MYSFFHVPRAASLHWRARVSGSVAPSRAGWRVVVRPFPEPEDRDGRLPRSLYLGNDAAFLTTVLCGDVITRRLVPAPASTTVRAYITDTPEGTVAIASGLDATVSAVSANEYLVEWTAVSLDALAALLGQRVYRVVEQPGDWRDVAGLVVRDELTSPA